MLKGILITIAVVFVMMNVVAAIHAYRFTHFAESGESTTKPEEYSFSQKLGLLITGVVKVRPKTAILPTHPYTTIRLQSNKNIECWDIKTDNPNPTGTVALFHGYGGEKSELLDKSAIFLQLGYNVVLTDFMGSGGSEGDQTTIGFKEAEEVKTVVDYIAGKGEKNIIIFATSMGSAATLRAFSKYDLSAVKRAILECPFGSMMQTVKNRFAIMHLPAFPMAQLMMFWGGVENGFDVFAYSPARYAKKVKCPVLMMYGALDPKVTEAETEEILNNLAGPKRITVFPKAGHENYLAQYRTEWTKDVTDFLQGK